MWHAATIALQRRQKAISVLHKKYTHRKAVASEKSALGSRRPLAPKVQCVCVRAMCNVQRIRRFRCIKCVSVCAVAVRRNDACTH